MSQLSEQENKLREIYIEVLYTPFHDKYDEKWDEPAFWIAVEEFKVKSKEIGYEDPLEVMGKFGMGSFERIRDDLKEGPPKCFREGWKSEMLGETLDVTSVLKQCEHVSGPEFTFEQKIVLLDFWASWCKPCIRAAPELSDLAEKHAGRVAVVGVNNEGFFKEKEHDIEKIKTFLEDKKDAFRYTVLIDNKNQAKEIVFKKCGYEGVPCLILIDNNIVKYVGGPGDSLEAELKKVLEKDTVAAKEE